MDRRTFLRAGAGAAAAASLAGCLDDFLAEGARDRPPLIEDRPDAVYVPTHVDGMEMIGMADLGSYKLALSYTFPHRFWLVTGDDARKVGVEDESVHLMASLWHPDTGVFPPVGNVSLTVRSGGEVVDDRRAWAMLSQTMGFHYGDNVPLAGDDTYEVEVSVDPPAAHRTGAFQDEFQTNVSTALPFEYSEAERDEIGFQRLEDRRGERDAVAPMEMDVPVSQLPREGELPGEVIGRGTSGDGRFVVTTLPEPPAGVEGDGQYLAVSARTPYNRYPLPFMSLSAAVTRDGETVFDGPLTTTLHPELDYHYGAAVDGLESGDELTISVGAPPQVARHEGYETAFLAMEDVELTV